MIRKKQERYRNVPVDKQFFEYFSRQRKKLDKVTEFRFNEIVRFLIE